MNIIDPLHLNLGAVMHKHRRLTLSRILKSLAVAGAAIVVASTAAFAFQQATQTETSFYPSQPSLELAEADTAHLGPERTILRPEEDTEVHLDEIQLQRHGLYRLIPADFVGEVDHDVLPLKWAAGIKTSDERELVKSPLYREVHGVPSNLRRVIFDSHDSTSGVIVRQVFKSDDGQQYIEVTRRAVLRSPIDIDVPGKNAGLELSLEVVSGVEAIVYRRSNTSPNPNPLTFIQTNDGEIETIIVVRGLPEQLAFSLLDEFN